MLLLYFRFFSSILTLESSILFFVISFLGCIFDVNEHNGEAISTIEEYGMWLVSLDTKARKELPYE